jgi:hypothetical protein
LRLRPGVHDAQPQQKEKRYELPGLRNARRVESKPHGGNHKPVANQVNDKVRVHSQAAGSREKTRGKKERSGRPQEEVLSTII